MDEHLADHLNQRGRNYLHEIERERFHTIESTADVVGGLEAKFEEEKEHEHEETLCCWEEGSRHFYGSFTKSLYGITQDEFSIVRLGNDGSGKFTRLLNVDQASVLAVDQIVASQFITRSDRRLKSNIIKRKYDASLIGKLNIVNFNYNGTDVKTIGMIAQEVQKVDTNLVKEDKQSSLLSISYNDILCLTIQHTQELQKRIEILEQKHVFDRAVTLKERTHNYTSSLLLAVYHSVSFIQARLLFLFSSAAYLFGLGSREKSSK